MRSGFIDLTDRPILIIGPHRSGTTWLSHAFENVPELAFIREPRQIWEFGHWFRQHQRLTAADASPIIRHYIRRRFRRIVSRLGKTRFCEKTPSNCLRIGFLKAIYPNAKIVFIFRDGRAVLRSVIEVQRSAVSLKDLVRRIRMRLLQSSVFDLPGVITRLPLAASKAVGRPVPHWGTYPPGWREWVAHDTPVVVAAKQWSSTIGFALDDLANLGDRDYISLKYEDLVADPEPVMERLCDFVELDDPRPVMQYVRRTRDPQRNLKWQRQLSVGEIEEVRPVMLNAMLRLGYEW